jgi:lysophospholipase L1-like esterase
MIQGSAFGPDLLSPEVLLIAPPPTCVKGTGFEEMFAGADATSRELGTQYHLVADEHGCNFLDASQVIVSSKLDGIHLDASELPKLARAIAAAAKEILE